MTTTTHLEALERALAASDVDEEGADALWVASLRSIARKLDATAAPSDRLLQMWQSESKRLSRRQRADAPAPAVAAEGAPLHLVDEGPLAKYRRGQAALAIQRTEHFARIKSLHAAGDHSLCARTTTGIALCGGTRARQVGGAS